MHRRVLQGSTRAAVAGAALAVLPVWHAQAADVSSPSSSWTDALKFTSPFSPCAMNCAVTGFAGAWVKSSMSSIYVTKGRAPWDWKFGDSGIVGASFSREVLTYGRWWAFETELGAAKRFGDMDEFEAWGALYWRWKAFPWNGYIRTSAAISTGLNIASDVSGEERRKSPGHTSKVLHYLSPELTLGLPDRPDLDLVFRFHHRSGGELKVFDDTGGGAQYATVGVRYRW